MTRRKTSGLTPRQEETLRWVKAFVAKNGLAPTVREIGTALKIKSSTAFWLLKVLQRKGYLRRGAWGARSLIIEGPVRRPREAEAESAVRFLKASADMAGLTPVPVVGLVTAGQPILAQEHREGEVFVDPDIASRGRCFGLRIHGDSMTGVGIREGHVIIARQQSVAEDGDIVVAMLGDEATVKQLSIRGDKIELKPRNRAHRNIPIGPEDELRILGKVIAVTDSEVRGWAS